VRNTNQKTTAVLLLLTSLLVIQAAVPLKILADIYMYVDENGVMHFSNVPNSPKYRMYMKEGATKKLKKFKGFQKYDAIIRTASKRYGVEGNLIRAIIKAESGFNPKAVSKKGAKGLMQIMPGNFKILGITNPFDPKQNIMAGTKYYRRMYDKYKKTSLALAAYNAGPTSVDKYNAIPPYKETKEYVKKVLKYYREYS